MDTSGAVVKHQVTILDNDTANCALASIVTDGAVLTVSPDAVLETQIIVNRDANKLIIQADENGMGTVKFSNTYVNPKATVQMYFKGGTTTSHDTIYPDWQYRGFIGNPDKNQTLKDIVIYKWDETYNNVDIWGNSVFYDGYVNKSATGNFTPWNGFAMANFDNDNAERAYTTTLLPTNKDTTFTLTRTTTAPNGSSTANNCGVNLLTNSYSAPINITALSGTDIDNTVYFFNTRTWRKYKTDSAASIQTCPINSANYVAGTGVYIPSGQSFAVKVNSTANSGTLTIPYTSLEARSSGAMYAPKQDNDNTTFSGLVRIAVDGDELYLIQSDICSAAFENGYDGTKLFASNADQIYALTDYGQTAVNADRTLLGQYIGFKPLANGTRDVTLRISSRDLEGYEELYLYDNVADRYVEITDDETSYTFTTTNEENPRRFQIVGKATDGTQFNPKESPRIEVAGGEVYLMNFDRSEATIIISDAAGRTVWSVNAIDGMHFRLPELAKGLYIVSCGKVSTKYIR